MSSVAQVPSGLARPAAVVVGLCAHGLGLVRALGRAGIWVIALESNTKLPGTSTCHAEVRVVPDINGTGLIDSLIRLRTTLPGTGNPVLFLTNDRMVNVIGRRTSAITDEYTLSWAGSARRLLPLLKKENLERRCREVGLRYPRSIVLTDLSGVADALGLLRFPVIAKPTRPLSAFKTLVADTKDALLAHRTVVEQALPILLQEFIPGCDGRIRFGALYLHAGHEVARFEGRKLRSRPMGNTTIAVSEPNDRIHDLTRQFFDGLELSGPVSLEINRALSDVVIII